MKAALVKQKHMICNITLYTVISLKQYNRPFSHFPLWFLNYTFFFFFTHFYKSYFPLRHQKVQFRAKFNENNIHTNVYIIWTTLTTCEFFSCYNIILWLFYKVQISTNYKKIIFNLLVLSIALPWTGIILPIIREITLLIKNI